MHSFFVKFDFCFCFKQRICVLLWVLGRDFGKVKLKYEERLKLEALLKANVPLKEIAKILEGEVLVISEEK